MKFAYCAVFVGVVSAFMSIPALGNIKLTFDENGNGTWQDSVLPTQNGYTGTSGTLAFSYAPDPTGNISGSVLIYKLPALVTSGPTDIGRAWSHGRNPRLQSVRHLVLYQLKRGKRSPSRRKPDDLLFTRRWRWGLEQILAFQLLRERWLTRPARMPMEMFSGFQT